MQPARQELVRIQPFRNVKAHSHGFKPRLHVASPHLVKKLGCAANMLATDVNLRNGRAPGLGFEDGAFFKKEKKKSLAVD